MKEDKRPTGPTACIICGLLVLVFSGDLLFNAARGVVTDNPSRMHIGGLYQMSRGQVACVGALLGVMGVWTIVIGIKTRRTKQSKLPSGTRGRAPSEPDC